MLHQKPVSPSVAKKKSIKQHKKCPTKPIKTPRTLKAPSHSTLYRSFGLSSTKTARSKGIHNDQSSKDSKQADLSPLRDDDLAITQFKPVKWQWKLNDDNIKHIDPETGETILHNYCEHINTTPLPIFKHLIESKGCDVNAQGPLRDAPVFIAFDNFDSKKGGDSNILTYLLGKDLNVKNQYDYTLLHSACDNINQLPLDVFKLLIETKGCDVNTQDENNETPIHNALRFFRPNDGGDVNTLKYLLGQADFDVNMKTQDNFTLIHYSCENINSLPLDTFKWLIETMGGDINVQNSFKNTPLHYALKEFDSNKGGDINSLNYLLNQKVIDVNVKGSSGANLLHEACYNPYSFPLEVFQLLIETKGLNVNHCNQDNGTPLHTLMINLPLRRDSELYEVVEYLIEKGVKINHKDFGGETVLDWLSPHSPAFPFTYDVLMESGAKLGKDC
jgi:ankyrin repeat protein